MASNLTLTRKSIFVQFDIFAKMDTKCMLVTICTNLQFFYKSAFLQLPNVILQSSEFLFSYFEVYVEICLLRLKMYDTPCIRVVYKICISLLYYLANATINQEFCLRVSEHKIEHVNKNARPLFPWFMYIFLVQSPPKYSFRYLGLM